MKKFLLPLLLFLFNNLFSQNAQPNRAVLTFLPHQLNQAELWLPDGQILHRATALGEIPLQEAEPFLAWSIVWQSDTWNENDHLFVFFSDGNKTTDSVEVHPDTHADEVVGRQIGQLYFTEKNVKKIRLQFVGEAQIKQADVHFFNPGKAVGSQQLAVGSGPPKSKIPNLKSLCPCPQPDFLARTEWCPEGNCPPNPSPSNTTVTHLIVHHSAGTNVANDWSAVVRAIWDFHVNVNGWSDVGYNWLVDPNGVMYEGRGDDILGAHFCGTNAGTMGVCMMGTYTTVPPTDESVETLKDLLTWKACDANIPPEGTAFHASSGKTLNRISGHRDGCATSCPGDMTYALLPAIRQAVSCRTHHGCQEINVPVTPPTNLVATAIAPTHINLTWQDNASNEQKYLVERETNGNMVWFQLAELPANSTSFDDFGVFSNTTYSYRVRGVEFCDGTANSGAVTVMTEVSATHGSTASHRLEIFPNPAGEKATLLLDNQWIGSVEVSIFDALGRTMPGHFQTEKTAGQVSLEIGLEGFGRGAYFVRLGMGGEVIFGRFLKN